MKCEDHPNNQAFSSVFCTEREALQMQINWEEKDVHFNTSFIFFYFILYGTLAGTTGTTSRRTDRKWNLLMVHVCTHGLQLWDFEAWGCWDKKLSKSITGKITLLNRSINISHQPGTFVTIYESTWKYHNDPKWPVLYSQQAKNVFYILKVAKKKEKYYVKETVHGQQSWKYLLYQAPYGKVCESFIPKSDNQD